MTVWKKAMSYLGLGPDDAYDDYDVPAEPAPRGTARSGAYPAEDYGVRPVPRQPRPEDSYSGRPAPASSPPRCTNWNGATERSRS